MAKQIINIGTLPDDGTGESNRSAFNKCNQNFTELYAAVGQGPGLTFSSLADGPTTYSDNQLFMSNGSANRVLARDLIAGAGIIITIDDLSDPPKITIKTDGGMSPELQSHMNANNYIIGNIPTPTPTLVNQFNALYPDTPTTIDKLAINKSYADTLYLPYTGGTLSGVLTTSSRMDYLTGGNTIGKIYSDSSAIYLTSSLNKTCYLQYNNINRLSINSTNTEVLGTFVITVDDINLSGTAANSTAYLQTTSNHAFTLGANSQNTLTFNTNNTVTLIQPLEFDGNNTNYASLIRIKNNDSAALCYYDANQASPNIYNYTLKIASGQFNFAVSSTNTAYHYGSTVCYIDKSGNINANGTITSQTGFSGDGSNLSGTADNLNAGNGMLSWGNTYQVFQNGSAIAWGSTDTMGDPWTVTFPITKNSVIPDIRVNDGHENPSDVWFTYYSDLADDSVVIRQKYWDGAWNLSTTTTSKWMAIWPAGTFS